MRSREIWRESKMLSTRARLTSSIHLPFVFARIALGQWTSLFQRQESIGKVGKMGVHIPASITAKGLIAVTEMESDKRPDFKARSLARMAIRHWALRCLRNAHIAVYAWKYPFTTRRRHNLFSGRRSVIFRSHSGWRLFTVSWPTRLPIYRRIIHHCIVSNGIVEGNWVLVTAFENRLCHPSIAIQKCQIP